jgi:phosphoribosylaminoimidazolecarboxamide formyltransferase/IMP cyclohydrolase
LSVTDKTGIVDLAQGLARHGVEILSTGGTAKVLEAAGVKVRALADFTGSPEMLDGRVKTLHPRVHGGLLARRDLASHQAEMNTHGLEPIDLVAVNLYDFSGALEKQLSFEATVEEIDIGGPSMLRSAAKNHAGVLPLVDPADYARVLEVLDAGGDLDAPFRRALAHKVFAHTARYDGMVAGWLEGQLEGADRSFPEVIGRSYQRVQPLRYGENPHQNAAFYRDLGAKTGLAAAEILQGKELSYNNLLDLDAAMGLAVDLAVTQTGATAVYIKHNNPCGVATSADLSTAIKRARDADPVSAFGAVIALTQPIDEAAAIALTEAFVEAVIAPGVDEAAQRVFAAKKNVRVLRLADPAAWQLPPAGQIELRKVRGGGLGPKPRWGTAVPRRGQEGPGGHPPGADRGRVVRPWLRLGGRQTRPIQRDRVCRPGSDLGGGRWPNEPGRLGEDLPAQSRGGAPGGRRGLRRFFPLPRRRRSAGRGRRHRHHPTGWEHPGRRGHRCRRWPWSSDGLHRRATLPPLT